MRIYYEDRNKYYFFYQIQLSCQTLKIGYFPPYKAKLGASVLVPIWLGLGIIEQNLDPANCEKIYFCLLISIVESLIAFAKAV